MQSFVAILRTSSILLTLHHVIPFMVDGGFACVSNPCIHGVCLDDLNSSYSCYCIDGYTGVQCQTNWDECWSNPCQNGGVCLDGIAAYNCSCPPGFLGDVCEEDFNECISNPCLNNGTCLDAPNGYSCNCPAGYSGVHCEIDVAVCNATEETRCANGGVCQEGPGFTFSCRCQPGWTGFLCDVTIDECMSSPCQNGAICIDLHADYACACLFGFTGQNCDEVIMVCEDNPCRNSALCLMEEEHPICYCVPDYHGDRCQYQYDECQLGPRCMNGGTCIDGIDNFSCSCPLNLTGVLCECLIIENNRLDCTYTSPTTSYKTTTDMSTATTNKYDNHTEFTTDFSIFITTIGSTTVSTNNISEISTTHESSTEEELTSTTDVPNLTTLTTEISTTLEVTTTQVIETTTFEDTTTIEPSSFSTISSTFSTLFSTSFPISTFSSISTEFETSTDFTTYIPSSTDFSETITPTPKPTNFTTEIISTTINPTTLTEQITDETTFETTKESSITELSTEITTTELITSTNKPTMISETTFETTSELPSSTSPSTTYITKDGREMNYTLPPDIFTKPTTDTISSASTTEQSTIVTSTEFINLTTLVVSTETLSTDVLTIESAPTTTENYNVTIPPYFPDCSRKENRCRNGGTCIYTSEGHKCTCPFDTDGPICETHLGIQNAAFSGDSFLAHKLINNTKMSIDFKAKTATSNGLIFYAYIDKTYMALYVEHGLLKFKFSCGYQTMLLSELGKPINNGFELRINAELFFSKDFSQCNATIRLNNTISMTGHQLALVDKFSRNNSWLYLGGVPNDVIKDKIQPGFVGCMSALRISGKRVHIFKDAEDGYEIKECSSLACLSNPCMNYGVCVAHGDRWDCHCKNGYSGNTCETTICDNNPCQFGGTCLSYSGSGYICLCPYGKHGHFCENTLRINKPYFSSSLHGYSSYIAYPTPHIIPNKMEIKFKFSPTTIDQIAILMFLGQKGKHDNYSDHMAVSFVKGYVMLTWNLGSGPRRIFTKKPIESGKSNYLVQIGRLGRNAWLDVDNLGNVTGRSPGSLGQLDIFPLLYFGGHEMKNFSTLPHDLPLHTGFTGCISQIEFKLGGVLLDLESSSQVVGRALGQCGSTECHERICQNDGACLYHGGTFTCLCQDGYYGPLCSSKENVCDSFKNNCKVGSTCVPMIADYACDCPIGRSGKYCEKDEIISDIRFSGIRSYLSLPARNFLLTMFNIEFEIRPLKNEGIVMFIGSRDMFISVSIVSGLLELRVLPARKRLQSNQLLAIRSNKLLQLGDWHSIKFGLYGRKVYLFVNNLVNTGLLQTGEIISISESNIFIGGLPDLSTLPNEATPFLPKYYTGCFRKLNINSKYVSLTNISAGQNVQDCDGTRPCGGNYCENGGTCWLDPNLKPHCTCKDPYYGEKCELVHYCGTKVCENRGICIHGRCRCIVGWNGAFCETALIVKTPKFKGNSYIVVNRSNKKRHTSLLKNVFLNFTTASPNGLLLWTQKDDIFVGIGLEKGSLKLAYTTGISKEHIEVPDFQKLSDGLWHTLDISFKPFYVKIDSQNIDIPTSNVKNEFLASSDYFYLGGMPHGSPHYKDISKIFKNMFEGCIQSFSANNDYNVTDFAGFDGQNIDNCQLS